MKFNSNKNINTGQSLEYPIHKVINGEILTEEDSEFPKEFPNVISKGKIFFI